MDINIKNAVTTNLEFGSYTPKMFYTSSTGSWFRMDEYRSKARNEVTNETVHILNNKDLTPIYNGQRNSSKCYFCMVQCAHSEAEHNNNINN